MPPLAPSQREAFKRDLLLDYPSADPQLIEMVVETYAADPAAFVGMIKAQSKRGQKKTKQSCK